MKKLLLFPAAVLIFGCSEKVQPAKPFVQSRAELIQVYEFEQRELDRISAEREVAESRAADTLLHQLTVADRNTHVLDFKELESYIRAMPDDKIDDARIA